MASVSLRKHFSVELGGSVVRGMLDLPETEPEEGAPAVVLLCHGPPEVSEAASGLLAMIAESLVEAGVAAAGYEPSTDANERAVDDAAAVLHALALREDVDLNRIGVLGYSLGAIIAACLSGRSDQIARLCLLSAVTTDELRSRRDSESSSELAARLGAVETSERFLDELAGLTPEEDIKRYDRPTLILHGAADRAVEPQSSLVYRDAVRLAGHQIEHAMVALADHAFTEGPARSTCVEHIVRFFSIPSARPATGARS